MEEITVQQLKQKIDDGDALLVLDVREPFEKYQSDIGYEQTVLIPVDSLQDRVGELEEYKDKEVVCLCRSGSRSARACRFLEQQGFTDVKNLKGGINQWARDIDSRLPIY
ncbi:rhodanese-like domain-containing protein [Halalkalibaculum sp. DA3122]|uniref:rhodanese-like domain-containing protein n=1 Tax=Halalkalibaculum sp. DA3122 TaxID=3373607 RepID=UPI00375417BA